MQEYKCKHYQIHELVSPKIYQERGELAWKILDPRLLIDLDTIKEIFEEHYQTKVSVFINDYFWGGNYSQSGRRDTTSSHWREYSAHSDGCGFDLKFKIKGKFLPIKDCLDLIVANLDRLPAITRIEDIDYTPTWLHIDSRNEKQLRIVRP